MGIEPDLPLVEADRVQGGTHLEVAVGELGNECAGSALLLLVVLQAKAQHRSGKSPPRAQFLGDHSGDGCLLERAAAAQRLRQPLRRDSRRISRDGRRHEPVTSS